ncbi:MAG: hypothetical protein BHV90_09445 [Clostridiales bacterium 42_27]|nr:MAG: hypothetical protein BHV90_09445 [Clostridiales bacterium 42_27]
MESVIHLLKIRCSKSTGFFHQCNLVTYKRFVLRYDIKELGKQLKKIGMLVVQDRPRFRSRNMPSMSLYRMAGSTRRWS